MDFLRENTVAELGDGEAINVRARGSVQRNAGRLTVVTGSGATATISRVNDLHASARGTGGAVEESVTEDSHLSIEVDWPFYRVSVTGGSCHVAMV
jgi:hypothetical protein